MLRNPRSAFTGRCSSGREGDTDPDLCSEATRPDYVRFVRENNGGLCFSAIGMIGDEQKVRTDDKCETGTLAHELGHAIGLWHEQSRRDRTTVFVPGCCTGIYPGEQRARLRPACQRRAGFQLLRLRFDHAIRRVRRFRRAARPEYRDHPARHSHRAAHGDLRRRYRRGLPYVWISAEVCHHCDTRQRPRNHCGWRSRVYTAPHHGSTGRPAPYVIRSDIWRADT